LTELKLLNTSNCLLNKIILLRSRLIHFGLARGHGVPRNYEESVLILGCSADVHDCRWNRIRKVEHAMFFDRFAAPAHSQFCDQLIEQPIECSRFRESLFPRKSWGGIALNGLIEVTADNLKELRKDFTSLKPDKELGSGANGSVYLMKDRYRLLAVKRCPKSYVNSALLTRELDAMFRLHYSASFKLQCNCFIG